MNTEVSTRDTLFLSKLRVLLARGRPHRRYVWLTDSRRMLMRDALFFSMLLKAAFPFSRTTWFRVPVSPAASAYGCNRMQKGHCGRGP